MALLPHFIVPQWAGSPCISFCPVWLIKIFLFAFFKITFRNFLCVPLISFYFTVPKVYIHFLALITDESLVAITICKFNNYEIPNLPKKYFIFHQVEAPSPSRLEMASEVSVKIVKWAGEFSEFFFHSFWVLFMKTQMQMQMKMQILLCFYNIHLIFCLCL